MPAPLSHASDFAFGRGRAIRQRLEVELRQLPVAVRELIRLARGERVFDLELLESPSATVSIACGVAGVERVLHPCRRIVELRDAFSRTLRARPALPAAARRSLHYNSCPNDSTGCLQRRFAPLSAPLIDIGINLAHDSFDSDRAEVIQRAAAAGVTRMVITGSSLASTRAAIELVRSDPQRLRCTAGVHPHHATDLDESALQELATLAAQPEVVAVGECGLDYFRNFSPRPAQIAAFRRQLDLAVQAAQAGVPAPARCA